MAGIVALTNVVVATTMGTGPGGVAWGIVTGLGVGLAAGLVNGLLVGYLRLPAIIVTLATWSILRPGAVRPARPGGFVARGFADFPLQRVGPVPVAFLALAAVPGLLWWPISGRASATGCWRSAATSVLPTRVGSTSDARR